MTVELGITSLAQARLARGLTLEDAERGTRISRRFLLALEEHNYSVFPAPIYARGFLRTYCRYLGVDPEEQLEELPAGWASAPSTTLPPVSPGPINLNLKWLAAGALLVAVIGLGIILGRSGQEAGPLQTQGQDSVQAQPETQSRQDSAVLPGFESAQPEGQSPPATPETASEARSLDAGLPGSLPDFTNVPFQAVASFLDQQGIAFLRIDANSEVTPGLVLSQSPRPGSETAGLEQVTLTVSAGTTPIGAGRTDCEVLVASNQRTLAEQTYFENSCSAPAPPADRTDCEEIRGTDYRSPQERSFFLANCILQ